MTMEKFMLGLYISLSSLMILGIDGSKDQFKCKHVNLINSTADQCAFVQGNDDCHVTTGYIDYTINLYCTFNSPVLKPISWFLYLLLAVAVTSDKIFIPNLEAISETLHLSQSVSGETLLPLGNGAADIFTSIAAALAMQDGDVGILLGTLLGSGAFTITVIVGTIVVIRPFHTMERPMLRVLIFYMLAVYLAFVATWDGFVEINEAVCFFILYLAYVLTVVLGSHINLLATKLFRKCASRLDPKAIGDVGIELKTGLLPQKSTERPRTIIFADVTVKDDFGNPVCFQDLGPESLKDLYQTVEKIYSDNINKFDNIEEAFEAVEYGLNPDKATVEEVEINDDIVNKEPEGFEVVPYEDDEDNEDFDVLLFENFDIYPADDEEEDQDEEGRPMKKTASLVDIRQMETPPVEISYVKESSNQAVRNDKYRKRRDRMRRVRTKLKAKSMFSSPRQSVRRKRNIMNPRHSRPRRYYHTHRSYFPEEQADLSKAAKLIIKRQSAYHRKKQLVRHLNTPRYPFPSDAEKYKAIAAAKRKTIFESSDSSLSSSDESSSSSSSSSTSSSVTSDMKRMSLIRWFLEGLCPIEYKKWRRSTALTKFMRIVKIPILFVIQLTNPVIDDEEVMMNWNRPLNVLHCFVSPLFIIFAIGGVHTIMIGGVFPVMAILAVASLVLAIVVFFKSKTWHRPHFHNAFAFLGFLATVMWVYLLANEIVNLIQCFGLTLNLSQSILGLTALSWGNSIGDFVNNITVAKQGYSKMAITACYSSMLFNILVGLGLPLLFLSINGGGRAMIQLPPILLVMIAFTGFVLGSTYIAIPLIQRFYVRRPFAIYLFIAYAACLIVVILMEFKVLSI